MSSPSYQQNTVSPTGPSTSSTSTRNSKLDQIIQNFYTKTAQIVIQARCTPDNDVQYGRRTSLKGSSSNRKLNKWFNIATEDVELLREELKVWRTAAVQVKAQPMIIDIYLDTSKLSHSQSLLVADDNLRWSCVDLKPQASDARINRILIESWELTLNQPYPDYPVDLPNLYKRSIVFFRSLHSLARLLPTFDLYRKLIKSNDSSNPLSIGYRLSTSTAHQNNSEIPLGSTILESDARKPTKLHEFSNIVTPIGTFKLNVSYRRNCDFRVEDVERDLSAQFIDMDEQYFTPTMAKYQQQKEKIPINDSYRKSMPTRPASMFTKTTPSSLDSKVENSLLLQQEDHFSSSSILRNKIEPREITSQRPNTINYKMNHYNSTTTTTRNMSPTASTSSSRRASAPFVVSPFKSPFLSSSPQAESIFSGTSGLSKGYTPPERSRPISGASNTNTTTESGSYGRKIEFSSSFEKYKTSPSRTTASDSPSSMNMTRRWSRASDHSSIHFRNDQEEEDELEEFVKLVSSKQELKLFQQTSKSNAQLLSSTTESNSSSDSSLLTGSIQSKKTALSHFQNLRETHNHLSESLSSSMMLSAQQEPVSGVSPVSSTSSTGRSYQPIIPSPLHVEQKNPATPVHIPRSLPQLRSYPPQHPLRLGRLHQTQAPAPEKEDEDEDMSAFSTYPQSNRHQDLHVRHALTTGHSGYPTGGKFNTPASDRSPTPYVEEDLYRSPLEEGSLMQDNNSTIQSSGQRGNSSLMDDDDSLVFKMSELEFEGPLSTPPMHILNRQAISRFSPVSPVNNRLHERLEVSPPLLHRLQGMSIKQEEESGSNQNSDSMLKSSPLPFDTW